jgi:uncharacterized protein involved in type VI secretion and phage assembly
MSASLVQLIASEAGVPGRSSVPGVVTGIVTNNSGDPDGLGRVKVRFPWLSDTNESFWARIAAPMAGNDRGVYFLPEIDDEVLVVFERGDVRFPYVIGALWNGKDLPPADNTNGRNDVRMIKSRSGHVIRLNDQPGQETIEIADGSGRNRIVIDVANDSITITSGADIVLAAPQGTVRLAAKTIEIESSGAANLKAGAGMDVTAGKTLNVAGSTVNIN